MTAEKGYVYILTYAALYWGGRNVAFFCFYTFVSDTFVYTFCVQVNMQI